MLEPESVTWVADRSTVGARTYDALGFTFEVSGTAGSLLDEVRWLLSGLESDAHPEHDVNLLADSAGRFRLAIDGEQRFETGRAGVMVQQCIFEITRHAVAAPGGALVLHAGAIDIDGTTVIVSGRSGAGKSTLVASLVAAGAGYLTDEAVRLAEDGTVSGALSRPIQLDLRSRQLLELGDDPERPAQLDGSYYVPVDKRFTTRPRASAPTAIVLLDGLGDRCVTSEPKQSEVVAWLIGESFDPGRRSASGLRSIARLCDSDRVIRLSGGTPRERVDAVREFLA